VPFAVSLARSSLIREIVVAAGLVALTIAGVRLTDRADARRAVRESLADGARFDDSLTLAARGSAARGVSFPGSIALSYLARTQLGLGSPFRLVDLARSDPRLPIAWRSRVAHAILARVANDRHAMRVQSRSLSTAMWVDSGAARAMLRVVDSSMALDDDALLTLEALRIASAQASARGMLRSGAVPLIGAAGLLALDRARARRDVERAIAAASRDDGDVLRVVTLWRAERRLLVERPLLADVTPLSRRVAARVGPLVSALERALRTRDSVPSVANIPPMPRNAGAVMSLLISVRTRPVQPQVRLSVLDARVLAVDRRIATSARATRVLLSATNEETLILALAESASDTTLGPLVETGALLASQGLRTLAQEAPFHPGLLSLDPEQVAERLGLESLTFGRDVPETWRPFYAREFAAAVDAVREVFPLASVAGLKVRIGDKVKEGALAVHDPRSRLLTLPLATGFGAVGHEIMHDLDWQSARDHVGRRGIYATDNAWRGTRTEPIAAPLARLAEFVPAPANSGAWVAEARRPAELLARSADWFLATALARRGRINGALSAVQDGWVRGYASATGPDAFGDHEAALAALFDAMPMLAVRRSVGPRSDAERQPDLGAIARAAWFTTMPTAATSSSDATGSRLFPDIAGEATAVCSPVARLRVAPMLATARGIAAGFVAPRVERAMRRWARTADVTTLGSQARLVRLGLLGAPVDAGVLDSARERWTEAAWRALPCLTPQMTGDN
jgi:hypothetical protein